MMKSSSRVGTAIPNKNNGLDMPHGVGALLAMSAYQWGEGNRARKSRIEIAMAMAASV